MKKSLEYSYLLYFFILFNHELKISIYFIRGFNLFYFTGNLVDEKRKQWELYQINKLLFKQNIENLSLLAVDYSTTSIKTMPLNNSRLYRAISIFNYRE